MLTTFQPLYRDKNNTFVFYCQHMYSYIDERCATLSWGVRHMSEQQLDPVLVGRVIAQFRQSKGLSQEVLSGLAAIGRTHLSAIERGERKPTLETLYRLSTAMGVPMSVVVEAMEREIREQRPRH